MLAVDLHEIGEACDQSPASVSHIDVANEVLWPGELFDVDHGPDDFDEDDSDRWLPVVGSGSRAAYAVMERFISTIESPALAARLQEAITVTACAANSCELHLDNGTSRCSGGSQREL